MPHTEMVWHEGFSTHAIRAPREEDVRWIFLESYLNTETP